ncbi:MAG: hypothetical protein O9331_03935, partial [Acidovorax sp.]|nr:hypothetical protein [Acidovorax sp.]
SKLAIFHSNRSGTCLAGGSGLWPGLPIAGDLGCAVRLAAGPGKALVQLQKDFEQVLRPATISAQPD